MAYTLVLERPNNPDPIRWKWWLESNLGKRIEHLDEGAAPTCEIAAEEADAAYQALLNRSRYR